MAIPIHTMNGSAPTADIIDPFSALLEAAQRLDAEVRALDAEVQALVAERQERAERARRRYRRNVLLVTISVPLIIIMLALQLWDAL